MDGPYRDLGAGFARLTGPEGARRSPSRIASVEDALLELLRNARDADAGDIYVSSTLRNRRYRNLTVIDDGCGIPDSHKDLIFEPGVTTRHLSPVLTVTDPTPHGAGLSLYHLKNAAIQARVASTGGPGNLPTSITATFDTRNTPEKSLQSATRNSRTNLLATLHAFLEGSRQVRIHHAAPAGILATLLQNHIIQTSSIADSREVLAISQELGLEVSLRTVQRVLGCGIRPVAPVSRSGIGPRRRGGVEVGSGSGVRVSIGREETGEIEAILRRIVRARYLEIGDLRVESRPGEISFRVPVYEVEEEYE